MAGPGSLLLRSLLALSRHELLHRTCPLVTQSGPSDGSGWNQLPQLDMGTFNADWR